MMYNADMVGAICRASTKPLAILGIDACLMQMLETEYAARKVADLMVASQADETGASWSYGWLRTLKRAPDLPAETVAKEMVSAYRVKYRRCDLLGQENRTLSAVRLAKVEGIANELDALAESMIEELALTAREGTVLREIAAARAKCEDYGPGDTSHVDLGAFCDALKDSVLFGKLAAKVRLALSRAVVASYKDRNALGRDFGSNGIAIFFPSTGERYRAEQLDDVGYDQAKQSIAPVRFVYEHSWSRFLASYVSWSELGAALGAVRPWVPPLDVCNIAEKEQAQRR